MDDDTTRVIDAHGKVPDQPDGLATVQQVLEALTERNQPSEGGRVNLPTDPPAANPSESSHQIPVEVPRGECLEPVARSGLEPHSSITQEGTLNTIKSEDSNKLKILPLLRALWYDEDTKDVTIVSSDFGRVRCHAAILRLVSPLVAHLLEPFDNVQTEPVWIHLPDAPCNVVVEFLKRVYCVLEDSGQSQEGSPSLSNPSTTSHMQHLVNALGIQLYGVEDSIGKESELYPHATIGFVKVSRDPKAFAGVSDQTPSKSSLSPIKSDDLRGRGRKESEQETWSRRRRVCTAPVPAVKTVQELEFMGKAFLQGHGSMHGIPKARQMILEELASALWRHYEEAHKNDTVENQNYILNSQLEAGKHSAPGLCDTNMVVKNEVQDFGDFTFYPSNLYDECRGGAEDDDVKPDDFFDEGDNDNDYRPAAKKKKKPGPKKKTKKKVRIKPEEDDDEGVEDDDPDYHRDQPQGKDDKLVASKECHLCQRTFSNQAKLRSHVEKIHEVRDFQCGVCSMEFATSFDLHKHRLNEHDKKRKFKCEKCPQAFTETYKLKRHVRTVHDMNRADRSLKCDECESSFAKMAHLIRHKTSIHRSEVKPPPATDPEALEQQQESTLPATVKKETPSDVKPGLPKISGKPQLCTECGKTFENERLLSYHQNWHKGLQPYVCDEPDCVYRSHSKIGLQKHNIQMHREKTRSRRCPKCGHEGGPNHDRLHHDPALPYFCQEPGAGCDYRSAEPQDIKRHWDMKHNPENQSDKKTQCPYCVIQIVRSGLQRHLDRHHSPNLPFECSQCGFRGISKQSIKSHEGKYHSKKERIPCSFNCGQTFTQRFSMRRHTLRECPNSTTRDEIREAEKLSGKANERLQKNRQKAQEYMERASKFIKMSSTF